MVAEELPAVAPERRAQPLIVLNRPQGFQELGIRLVVEPRVAANRLSFEHIAFAIGQHRTAERPGLERHHRQALEIRR
jgi:hypothetical protein